MKEKYKIVLNDDIINIAVNIRREGLEENKALLERELELREINKEEIISIEKISDDKLQNSK